MMELTGVVLILAALVFALYRQRLASAIVCPTTSRRAEANGPSEASSADVADPTPVRSEGIDDHRVVLARVGVVLAAVGVALIGYAFIQLSGITAYPALWWMAVLVSLVFVVIFGATFILPAVFLLRGSLGAARLIAWLLAFSLVFGAGAWVALRVLLPQLFLLPLDLLLTEFRLNPAVAAIQQLSDWLLMVPGFLLAWWAYRQLRAPPVLAARAGAGLPTRPPKVAFILGAIWFVAFASLMRLMITDDVIDKAAQLARAQLGGDYKYHVTSINAEINGQTRRYSGIVAAYNSNEVRLVPVVWQQLR